MDQSEGSVLSDDNLDTPDEIDINVDDLDTPDEADSFEYTGQGNILDCKCRVRLFFFMTHMLSFMSFRLSVWLKHLGVSARHPSIFTVCYFLTFNIPPKVLSFYLFRVQKEIVQLN